MKYYVFLGLILLSLLVTQAGGGFGRQPRCSGTWVAGKTLPGDYDGCDRGSLLDETRNARCADGSKLEAFGELWAKPGDPIRDATAPNGQEEFASALRRCAPNS